MIALIGSGRLAHHLSYYLQSLHIPIAQWSRDSDPLFNTRDELDPATRLDLTLEPATHIWLAVRDDALAPVAKELSTRHPGKILVHFSGALSLPEAAAAHPLMTFGDRLESPEWYRSIPFLIEDGQDFARLAPGLPNPHFKLPREAKSFYHALCSLAGNSSFLLWSKIGEQFESALGLPRDLLRPFLLQVVANSSLSGERNFTGPVARGDWAVVKSHLRALEPHPELFKAYKSYLDLARSAGLDVPGDL